MEHPSSLVLSYKMQAPEISPEEQRSFHSEEDLFKHLERSIGPHLLFLNLQDQPQPAAFCEHIARLSPTSEWVLDLSKPEKMPGASDILTFSQAKHVLSKTNAQTAARIKAAIEHLLERRQTDSLLKLLRDQNQNMETQTQGLTKKIQRKRRQTESLESRLKMRNKNLELLSSGLTQIQNLHSITQLEKTLHHIINQLIPLSWVRIFFERQSAMDRILNDKNLIRFELDLSRIKHRGWMVLSPEKETVLEDEHQEFLEEISDSVVMAVHRIINLERTESIKQQWDATFDAISNPLCLVDDELKIIRTNKAFADHAQMRFSQLIGKNALQSFFKNNPEIWKRNPPLNLKLQVESQADGKFYSLVVHDLHFHIEKKRAHLLLIQDITTQHRLEKQIREKSKLVELGTIGSSIAHELNNPLAGMLSYLQLILMDADPKSDFYKDIKEMESGTLKCRDIVQNLLGFSRKQTDNERSPIQINVLIEKAIQLVEMKSRFSGIRFQLHLGNSLDAVVFGDQNALVQGLTHILKNSIEALQEKMSTDQKFMAEIKISTEVLENQYRILISDNGPGIPSKNLEHVLNPLFSTKSGGDHSGLGLTVAYSIFLEHDGGLELTSPKGQGVTAIISLPRPELGLDSRGIDTQI